MRVKLYKTFEHWYHGGTIWLISDTHFEDHDCVIMSDHWPTPDEYVKAINKHVGKNDTLIHLGDVGNPEWIKKIKGYKVLLLGNHDKGISNYLKKYTVVRDNGDIICDNLSSQNEAEEVVEEYKNDYCDRNIAHIKNNGLFDEVYEGPLFINEKICLSHEPIDLKFGINIHGHCHNGEQAIYRTNEYVDINIAADVRDFRPIRLDTLIGEFKTKDLHRVTIDKAKKNPLHKEK